MLSFVMGCDGGVMGFVMGKYRAFIGLLRGVMGYARTYARECILHTRIIVTIACASPARVYANARHARHTPSQASTHAGCTCDGVRAHPITPHLIIKKIKK